MSQSSHQAGATTTRITRVNKSSKSFTFHVLVLVLAVALIPLPTPASAQPGDTQGDNSVFFTDAAKDVAFEASATGMRQSQNASQSGSEYDHLDILKVGFTGETDDAFQVQLVLAKPAPPQQGAGSLTRSVHFNYGRLEWAILQGACLQQGGSPPVPNAGCLMYRDNPAAPFRAVKPVAAESTQSGFVFTVPKRDVFNENRLSAQYEQQFTNLYAYAVQTYATTQTVPGAGSTGSAVAFDRAPNTDYAPAAFVFRKGSGGHGDLAMTSPDPIRVSNGEATTIVYQATLDNEGEEDMEVHLSVKDIRSDWTVRHPPVITVKAKSIRDFPVILTIPFTHDHGKTVMFKLRADVEEDANSWAEVLLGVWWTDVPQPSAHHNAEIWFHSAPSSFFGAPEAARPAAPFVQYWMNSIEKDPNPSTTDEDAPAFFNDYATCAFRNATVQPTNCQAPPTFSASWFFPLSPELLIGLDFDLAKEGKLLASIVPGMTSPSGTLFAEVRYCDPSTGTGGQGGQPQNGTACNNYATVLAKGSTSRALTARSAALFEVPLKPEPVADFLPFKRGANIGLQLRLVSEVPQNALVTEPRPVFEVKKSKLFLPLLEFHDPIDKSFAELGIIKLVAKDPFEKPVNPGRTAVFRFTATNGDYMDQRLRIDVEGVNADWASVAGPREFDLKEGASSEFTIAVTAPGDAADQERAELFVVTPSLIEEGVMGLSRFRVLVSTATDIPDEAQQLPEASKEATPGLGVMHAALLVAVCAVLVARRRRGQ